MQPLFDVFGVLLQKNTNVFWGSPQVNPCSSYHFPGGRPFGHYEPADQNVQVYMFCCSGNGDG